MPAELSEIPLEYFGKAFDWLEAQFGAPFEKTYVEMFGRSGEEPHAGCYGVNVGLIGGGAVLEVEDRTSKKRSTFSRPHVIVGVDLATGTERWQSSTLAQPSMADSGIVGDRAFLSGSDGQLDLFDVKDGRVLYHRAATPVQGRVPRHLIQGDTARSRLFFSFEQEATLVDTVKGTTLWRTTLPADAWGIVLGSAVADYRIGADDSALAPVLGVALLGRRARRSGHP